MTSSSSSSSSPLSKLANTSLPPLSQNKGKLQDLKAYSKNGLNDTQRQEDTQLHAVAEKQKNTNSTNLEEATITSASSKTTLISPVIDADAINKNTKTHNSSSLLSSPERGRGSYVHDHSAPAPPSFQQGITTKENSATSSRRNSITSKRPSVFKNAFKKLFNGSSNDLSNLSTDSNTPKIPKARAVEDPISVIPSNRNQTKPSYSRTNSNKDFKSVSLSNMFHNAHEDKQKTSTSSGKPAKNKFQWGRKSSDLKKKLSMETISPFANKNNSNSIKISGPQDFQKISADTQLELENGTKSAKDKNGANQNISLLRPKSVFEELKVELDDDDMFADLLPSFGELDIDARSFELGDDKEKGNSTIVTQDKSESPKPELRRTISQETLEERPKPLEEKKNDNSNGDIDSLTDLDPISFQLNMAKSRGGSNEDVNTEYDLGTDLDYLSSVIGLGETEFFNTLETVKDTDRRKSIRIKSLEKKKSLSRTNTITSQGSASSSIITSKTTASTVRSFELEETSYDNSHYNKSHELGGDEQVKKGPSSPELPQVGQLEVVTTNILKTPHQVQTSKGCLKSNYVDPNNPYNYHAHRSPYITNMQYDPNSSNNFKTSSSAASTASSSVPLSPFQSTASLSSSVYPTTEGSTKNNKLPDLPMKKSVSFSSRIYLNETHSSYDYDRFNLSLKRTYHMLNTNPNIVKDIRIELNNYKKTMPIHDLSRRNTHFFMT
ncbi:unnamed protein product [[Candida] boidinii]|uniref:Unnamed protein product n=1 Tax=Candida boidinii TaxID=5477 RepID=A0ACB5TM37_CANBO|nr:unnamed protein product [[Candida] boidinii]